MFHAAKNKPTLIPIMATKLKEAEAMRLKNKTQEFVAGKSQYGRVRLQTRHLGDTTTTAGEESDIENTVRNDVYIATLK